MRELKTKKMQISLKKYLLKSLRNKIWMSISDIQTFLRNCRIKNKNFKKQKIFSQIKKRSQTYITAVLKTNLYFFISLNLSSLSRP